MSQHIPNRRNSVPSRREFMGASTAAAVAGSLGIVGAAHAAGSDEIKIALIGCGGRGSGATVQAMNTPANVKLVAMADAFQDRVDISYRQIASHHPDRVDVPDDRKFVGLDAYRKAIEADVDLVILATPPGFRPIHFEAAVNAGKHVFMEKPVATDAPGVRRILAANQVAKQKGLIVAVGLNLRHEDRYREVVDRIHNGAIGELNFLRTYYNSGGVWVKPREPGQTEMQYQVRNWYYFNWLSGDHIVEQHVHSLDACNWIMKGPPVEAQGTGGRQVRKGKNYGEIFDHHSVEFTYADGTKMFSYCRHMPNCWVSVALHAHGTKGSANIEGVSSELHVDGQEPLKWRRGKVSHQVEHDDLFAALLEGRPYNEGDYGATSTMTAIMGRMATYSGQIVRWDDAIKSEINLAPSQMTWDAEPQSQPDEHGLYACAIPGVTKVI